MHAFRIRSPFGKDSLYVVLTGRPKDGGTVRLELEGAKNEEVASFPYEFSVYPWPMEQDLALRLVLTKPDGTTTQTSSVRLAGTKTK